MRGSADSEGCKEKRNSWVRGFRSCGAYVPDALSCALRHVGSTTWEFPKIGGTLFCGPTI